MLHIYSVFGSSASGVGKMPPKRNAAQLRALAEDPVGWLQTPVAKRTEIGIAGDYLSAFLKRHVMPVTRRDVNNAHGPRLWQSMKKLVPVEQRNASIVFPGGILALVHSLNHGFAAPLSAQENLLTLLRALPVDPYKSVADALQNHYALCRAFRLGPEGLNSPPSYLDLYKDNRVGKKWRADCAFPSVLINANELLCAWQGLMGPTWNASHAARDVEVVWESCRTSVDALHADVDGEGALSEEEKKRARCFSTVEDGVLWLNYISFVVFVNGLPGPLAKTLLLCSSFFDAFTDIGSRSAKAFLEAKLKRAAGDQVATQLRSDTDGPSLEIVSNLGEERNGHLPEPPPLDLNAFVRTCLEDDDVDPQVAERRVAKAALVRRFQESSDQELALAKRRRLADIERYEADTRANIEKIHAEMQVERDQTQVRLTRIQAERQEVEANIEETRARKEANIEKIHAEMQVERDQTQVRRARSQAERQEVEENASAAQEERDRQRCHASQVAAAARREEIRDRTAKGIISQEDANDMLGENRRTLIVRLEKWIGTHCKCETPSRCSSVLGKMFNVEVEAGRHVKPLSHRNEAGRWNLYMEHDGPLLQRLHQQLEDKRKGVRPNQTRLSFTRES